MTHTPALVRIRAVPALAVTLLLAALLVPVPQQLATFFLPADHALPAGARVLQAISVADALLVTAPTVPSGAVPADSPLGFRSLLTEPAGDGEVLDSGVAATDAPSVWPSTTGERAVVALVDTGVAPVPALEGAIAGEIDFSGTGGGDGYGHGTYMASLIAARGPTAPGAAPGTGILSLKVADDDGATDLGRVLSALQWLYGPGRGLGVRIAALALGVDADSPAAPLLDLATARLAADGVLVVTAAGNDGEGQLSSPATAPGTFSVGAVHDQGTADRADDTPASFSATGVDRLGVAQPDITASGVDVVGHMHPDAAIARAHPDAFVGDGLIRGSGTSMSTALTAGVAALVSSTRPDLDVAGLDEALRAGGGQLDAVAAVSAAMALPHRPGTRVEGPATPPAAQANGHGSAHHADAAAAASIRWRLHWDGATWDSIRWRSIRWRDHQWGADRWGSIRWGSIRWRSIRWRGTHWGDPDWEIADWGSIRWRDTGGWAGDPYDGEVEWGSIRWRSIRWASIRWASIRWK